VIDMHGEGTGRIAELLETVAHRALNPEPAFDGITGEFVNAEKRLFASPTRLKADTEATKKRKARDKRAVVRANADRTLVATGALEKFLTTQAAGAQPVQKTSDELILGVPGGRHDLHYARYQAKHGRNPLVSAATIRRFAGRELATFLVRSPLSA
jgi:hypothetical protein